MKHHTTTGQPWLLRFAHLCVRRAHIHPIESRGNDQLGDREYEQGLRERRRLHVRRDHDPRIRRARRRQCGPGTRSPRSSSIPGTVMGKASASSIGSTRPSITSFLRTTESGTFQFTLLATGNHLFEEGNTYVSIQWNKAVTEIFGPTVPDDGQAHNHLLYGSIDRSADAWEILLDAARLLKDPSAYPGRDRPARVATVLSSGYSRAPPLSSSSSPRDSIPPGSTTATSSR